MSYDKLWKDLESAVHNGPGELSPEQRQRARSADHAPEVARSLVEKLHARPAEIDDADVAALVEAGWSEDEVFELVVSGSVAAGRRTLDVGLAALRDGGE